MHLIEPPNALLLEDLAARRRDAGTSPREGGACAQRLQGVGGQHGSSTCQIKHFYSALHTKTVCLTCTSYDNDSDA